MFIELYKPFTNIWQKYVYLWIQIKYLNSFSNFYAVFWYLISFISLWLSKMSLAIRFSWYISQIYKISTFLFFKE